MKNGPRKKTSGRSREGELEERVRKNVGGEGLATGGELHEKASNNNISGGKKV